MNKQYEYKLIFSSGTSTVMTCIINMLVSLYEYA